MEIKIVPMPKNVSDDKNLDFGLMAMTSRFLKTLSRLLPVTLHPGLNSGTDPYNFANKWKRSALDAAVVLHHIIISSMENCKMFDAHLWIIHLPLFQGDY